LGPRSSGQLTNRLLPRRKRSRQVEATGENLIERIAGVSDYQVAVATYRAAVERWPGAKITLRNRARVIERSWED
jgi:hypothetical protein